MTTTAEVRERPRVAFWNNPKVRSILFQIALLLFLAVMGYEIVVNTMTNLKSRNIASGFGFLSKTAGFDIIQSLIPYSSSSSYGRAILVGFYNTILVSVLSIIAATVIGFIMGVARLSKNWLVARIGTLYVEIFRNIPLLLWIFIFYSAVLQPLPGPRDALSMFNSFFLSNRGFMMPRPLFDGPALFGAIGALSLVAIAIMLSYAVARWARARQMETGQTFPVFWASAGIIAAGVVMTIVGLGFRGQWEYPELGGFNFRGGIHVIPELMAMFLALSIYTGTYIAEAVRAGILAVSHGQTEASYALGLRPGTALRLVVIPQAMRVIIPPLASTYLSLTKNSSLAVAIGYPDLVATGGVVLNQSGQAVEILGIFMVVYLSLSLITAGLMNWFNARMKLVER